MNKRRLHHLWVRLRWIRPWYFLILAIAAGVICTFALRANNQHMIKLRDAVFTADKNNTDVQTPLKALQAYVTTHMNTDLNAGKNPVYPPVQLQYTYNRLIQAQSAATAAANTEVYSQAQAHCEALNHADFSGRNRVPCIEEYVQSHTTAAAAIIPDALYKFAFVTPVWSPDLAGWTMVAAIAGGAVFIITFIADRWFRRQIKHPSVEGH